MDKALLRKAIFEVLDHGDTDQLRWELYEIQREKPWASWLEDEVISERLNFANAVTAKYNQLKETHGKG